MKQLRKTLAIATGLLLAILVAAAMYATSGSQETAFSIPAWALVGMGGGVGTAMTVVLIWPHGQSDN